MLDTEAVQAHIHALGDATGAEIEVRQVVAAEFGAERVTVARHPAQGDAQQHFAHSPAIERRGVDEVQPAFERNVDGPNALIERDRPEFLPERAGAETEHGKPQSGPSEESGLHAPLNHEWAGMNTNI